MNSDINNNDILVDIIFKKIFLSINEETQTLKKYTKYILEYEDKFMSFVYKTFRNGRKAINKKLNELLICIIKNPLLPNKESQNYLQQRDNSIRQFNLIQLQYNPSQQFMDSFIFNKYTDYINQQHNLIQEYMKFTANNEDKDYIFTLFCVRLLYLIYPFISAEECKFECLPISIQLYPLLCGITGNVAVAKKDWSTLRENVLDYTDKVIKIKYNMASISNEYSNAVWQEFASYLLEYYFPDSILNVVDRLLLIREKNRNLSIRTNACLLLDRLPTLKFETTRFQEQFYTELLNKLESDSYISTLLNLPKEVDSTYQFQKAQENTIYSKMYHDYYDHPISELLEIIKSEN